MTGRTLIWGLIWDLIWDRIRRLIVIRGDGNVGVGHAVLATWRQRLQSINGFAQLCGIDPPDAAPLARRILISIGSAERRWISRCGKAMPMPAARNLSSIA